MYLNVLKGVLSNPNLNEGRGSLKSQNLRDSVKSFVYGENSQRGSVHSRSPEMRPSAGILTSKRSSFIMDVKKRSEPAISGFYKEKKGADNEMNLSELYNNKGTLTGLSISNEWKTRLNSHGDYSANSKFAKEYASVNMGPSDTDWKTINNIDNIDEEMEKVKALEAWQFGITNEKGISIYFVKHYISVLVSLRLPMASPSANQLKGIKKPHAHELPGVNTKLIHTILANTEAENSNNLNIFI